MRNTIFGVVGLLISQILSFIARSIFIKLLGVEYNGVNGLFTNILQVLSLAELGFATSIAYALYRPLKERDEKTTAMLMRYFATVYRIIAIIVTIVGCACIPFLQYLISEDVSELSFSLNELRIYFAMYLANTVCSYLLAYKRTIITADQDSYIVSNVDNCCNVGLNILQIILLYITRNFYSYLAIMIAKTVVNNLIIHFIAGKKYPYLSKYKKEKLPKEEKSRLFKSVQAMACHRIGATIVNSTASIIISAFVGIVDAGKYSNYLMIVTGINSFVNIIFNSVTASIGNLYVEGDSEHQYTVFRRISYISNFIAVFVFVCYGCLFNDFIAIWVGADMQFSLPTVIAISMSGMLTCLRKTVNAFRDATGIFRQDWFKPLLDASIGISLAIGLSFVWGTFGVVLGYVLENILVTIPIENYILFKHGLKHKVLPQLLNMFLTLIFAGGLMALTYYICTFIPDGIGWFVLEFFFVMLFAAGIYFLATCRTAEFKYFVSLVKQISRKLFHKKASVAAENAAVPEGAANGSAAAPENAVAPEDTASGTDAAEEGNIPEDGVPAEDAGGAAEERGGGAGPEEAAPRSDGGQ